MTHERICGSTLAGIAPKVSPSGSPWGGPSASARTDAPVQQGGLEFKRKQPFTTPGQRTILYTIATCGDDHQLYGAASRCRDEVRDPLALVLASALPRVPRRSDQASSSSS